MATARRAAGGPTDTITRIVADAMTRSMARDWGGQPVVVESIGGSTVGPQRGATARPDGYTLGYLNVPSMYAGYLDPKVGRKESLDSFSALA